VCAQILLIYGCIQPSISRYLKQITVALHVYNKFYFLKIKTLVMATS